MQYVTPHLVCDGGAAVIEFYKWAFGATGVGRMSPAMQRHGRTRRSRGCGRVRQCNSRST